VCALDHDVIRRSAALRFAFREARDVLWRRRARGLDDVVSERKISNCDGRTKVVFCSESLDELVGPSGVPVSLVWADRLMERGYLLRTEMTDGRELLAKDLDRGLEQRVAPALPPLSDGFSRDLRQGSSWVMRVLGFSPSMARP
jgi:hypothetical protein